MQKTSKKMKIEKNLNNLLREHYFFTPTGVKPIVWRDTKDKRVEIDVDIMYTLSMMQITLLFDGSYIYSVYIDTESYTLKDSIKLCHNTISNMVSIIQSLKIGGYIK